MNTVASRLYCGRKQPCGHVTPCGHMTPGDTSFHLVNGLLLCPPSSSSVPSAASSLEVESSGQTDSLTVSWQHGEGSRSSYQVSAELQAEADPDRRRLYSHTNSCTDLGWKCQTDNFLHRGRGRRRHFLPSAELWVQPEGGGGGGANVCCCVQVFLYDVSGATLGAQTVGADHTSHVFSGLSPGHLYRSEVVTHSGELTNRVSAIGRTCKNKNRHAPTLDDSRGD